MCKVRPHSLCSKDSLKQENKIIDWILLSFLKNMHFQYKFGRGGFTIWFSFAINLYYWRASTDAIKCTAIEIMKWIKMKLRKIIMMRLDQGGDQRIII